jgi:hypothetical protein
MRERVSALTCLDVTEFSAAGDVPGCRSGDGVQQQPFGFSCVELLSEEFISNISVWHLNLCGGKDAFALCLQVQLIIKLLL